MENMFNPSTCAFCQNHNYEYSQYGWGHTNDCVLFQTVLKVFEDMLRRNGNIGAPYPGHMMNMGNQCIYPSTYPSMRYPFIFDVERSFGENTMDALATRMRNAFLTPPAEPADIWAARGSASTALQGVGSPREYDGLALAPSPEGYYVSDPQDAVLDDGDARYTEQHANFLVEPPFVPVPVPTAPGPCPSISVIEHFEQATYSIKQPVEGTPAGPVHFNDGVGVSLGSLATLANGSELAFDRTASIGEKASIRFELPQFNEHSIQVRVRHGGKKGRDGRPITLREMGNTVFDVLRKFMDHAERSGDPLRHGGSVVDIERVVLLRVDHISKGSIQPILGIRNNTV